MKHRDLREPGWTSLPTTPPSPWTTLLVFFTLRSKTVLEKVLDGVEPDRGDDNEVCNDAEDSQAHVQHHHQTPLMMIPLLIIIQNHNHNN